MRLTKGNRVASKPIFAIRFVIALALLIGVGMATPEIASAAGGVGSGGSGSGGGGGAGNYGWTNYGHGWALYSVNGGGPSGGFRSGSWSAIRNTCQATRAGRVAVYVLGTGYAGGGRPTGRFMGYNDVGYRNPWGNGGSVDGGRASKISRGTAHNYFNQLGSYGVSTSGYRWGSNVGWFCWDIQRDDWHVTPTTVAQNLTFPSDSTSSGNAYAYPGDRVRWSHTIREDRGPTTTSNLNLDYRWKTNESLSGRPNSTVPSGATNPSVLDNTRRLSPGSSYTRNYDYTIPTDLTFPGGQDVTYCQYMRSDKTAYGNNNDTLSSRKCVIVRPAPIPTCSTSLVYNNQPIGMESEPGRVLGLRFSMRYSPANRLQGVPNQYRVQISNADPRLGLASGYTFSGGSQSDWSPGEEAINVTLPNLQRGDYPISWQLTRNNAAFSPPILCNGSIEIASKPYFRVLGGDIDATAVLPDAAGNCVVPGAPGVARGFNRGSGGSYLGASAQGAVFAGSNPAEIASASLRPLTTNPRGLTFANTNTSDEYGSASGLRNCLPNYWNTTSPTNSVPSSVDANGQTVVRSNGPVYIRRNITLNPVGWTINSVPAFWVIADGDIFIDPSVTNLDGVYVTKGKIYTCAPGGRIPSEAEIYSQCASKLTVNGSFIANQVKLLRSCGTVASASLIDYQGLCDTSSTFRGVAEVFNVTPDQWISSPQQLRQRTNGDSYDALYALPPVL